MRREAPTAVSSSIASDALAGLLSASSAGAGVKSGSSSSPVPILGHGSGAGVPVRIWVVEDQDAIRELLSDHLRRQPGMVLVGSSRDADPMIEAVIRREVDVVVLDLLLEGAGGLSALEVLKGQEPRPRVVIFSGIATAHTVQSAVEWGVSGYVEKSAPLVELNEAIDRARTSGAYFSSGPSALIREFIQRRGNDPHHAVLTARDRLILQQTALGIPTKRIAESLRLSEPSIYKLKKAIMRKLDVSSDQELTLCALSMGLIQPRPGFGSEVGTDSGPLAVPVG